MRQFPPALRAFAVFAGFALFTVAASAQETPETLDESQSRVRSIAVFLASNRVGSFYSDRQFQSERRPMLAFLRSSVRKRRPGFQKIFTGASGITQLNEISPTTELGLISSNGQRSTSNFFSVDGFAANLGVAADETSLIRNAGSLPTLTANGGLSALAPSPSVQEIAVRTMSSAKEQRVAGANLDFTSRAGNNRFSGSVFETFGNSRLNANDPLAQARGFRRAESRLNHFGGGLGGFIKPDSAWFYLGYDGLRLRQPAFALTEVPDILTRNSSIATIRPVFDAFPLTNGRLTSAGFAEAAASFTNPATHDIFGVRIDLQPTSDFRVSSRYSIARSDAALRADRGFSLNTNRLLDNRADSLSISATYVLNSGMLVAGRVGFGRNRVGQEFSSDDFGGGLPIARSAYDFLKYDFGSRGGAIASGQRIETTLGQFQTAGSFDWNFNRNQLTIGAEFRRISLNAGLAGNERTVLFESTGAAVNGTASRIVEITRSLNDVPKSDNAALFAQMTTRAGSRLRFDYGARLDMDFAAKTAAPDFSFEGAVPQMRDRRTNFAPRFGFAFDITGRGRATLRGGAGLYYDLGNSAAAEVFASSAPYSAARFARDAAFTASPNNPLAPLLLFDEALRTPRAWHLFAEYQQEVFDRLALTATFTESFGRQLYTTETPRDADAVYRYIRVTGNDGESRHRSLQLRLERRFSRGFSFVSRYTIARSTDNYSPDTLRETNGSLLIEGPSDLDLRQQFSAAGSYDLPQFFDGGIAKTVFEDWSFSATVIARSGFPVDVGIMRANDFGAEFSRAVRISGVAPYLDESTIRRLNPAAFSVASANGNQDRNGLRGFGFFQLDTNVRRRFRFTNEIGLDISLNAYNLPNNTNYADMSGILGTQFENGTFRPNKYFGRTTGVYGGGGFTPQNLYGGARSLTIGVRFVF